MLSDRQIISMQSAARRGVPATFVHTPAAGKPAPPHYDTVKTFTADAGTDLITSAGHGLSAGRLIRTSNSGGALPGGLTAATDLFVIASGLDADHYKVSATFGGSAVNITDAGTGIHSWSRYLTAAEKAEVDAYMLAMNSTGPAPATPTRPGSAAMIADLEAYHAGPSYRTWWHDDQLARESQYNLRRVDVSQASEETLAASADPAGSGSDPVSSPVTPYVPSVPPQVEAVEAAIDSGTLGSTPVDVSLTTPTGGAVIYVRQNGGTWFIYIAPVTLPVADRIDFYASKSGYSDSVTDTFENA
jgi:hypothetical protein